MYTEAYINITYTVDFWSQYRLAMANHWIVDEQILRFVFVPSIVE
jgi:hypothetical protein